MHGVALEELLLAVDAVGHADDRARPALDVADHPGADRFVVARQIELGDRLAVAGVGPQRLCPACEMVTPITTDDPCGRHGRWGDRHRRGLGRARRCRGRRRLGLDLLGRLVLAQTLERGLADQCRRR